MGSLARRVQRQEQQGATGTFGRLASGVERAERFAGRIAAHFPAIAAKYEPPAAPEGGASAQPAVPSGPSFTYYPEGAGGSSSKQPTMTAAEVLKQFGATSSSAPVQRAPATESQPPKPAAPSPQPQPARDPRRIRRFSKIEEVPQHGEVRKVPPAAAPARPQAQPVQRKPEPARAAAPQRTAPPAPPEAKAQTPPPAPRRRSHFEEVSTPSSDEAPVQRSPEKEAPPIAAPETNDEAGPLRWDHLGDLPPSMQRQLERVQQRLSEQSGLTPSADAPEIDRPFHPRNPNPPPQRPAESLPSRLPSVESEPEAPISFGPDLEPRPAAVQRQAEPPAAARPRAGIEPGLTELEALDQPIEPVAVQRMVDQPPAIQTSPREQAMLLWTPPEPKTGEPPELAVAFVPPVVEPDIPAPRDIPAVERSPEPSAPVDRPLDELTLRQPVPASQEPPVAQREAVEPESESKPPARSVSRAPTAAADVQGLQAAPQAAEPATPALGGPVAEREPVPPQPNAPAAPLASQVEHPLILRQPADPAETAARAETINRADVEPEPPKPDAATRLPSEMGAPAEVVPPVLQRSSLPGQPADESLVLRQPPQPHEPPSAPEAANPAQPLGKRSAVQRAPAPEPTAPVAEIQREANEGLKQPLTLRETPIEAPEERPGAATEPEHVAPLSIEATPLPPAVQRQVTTGDDMSLLTPPAPIIEDDAPSGAEASVSEPEPTEQPRIQRQAEMAVPVQAMPLRAAAEAIPAPRASEAARAEEAAKAEPARANRTTPAARQTPMPAAPRPTLPTAVQRQTEPPASSGPGLSLPLRQPPAVQERGPGEPGPSQTRSASAPPQVSWGSQIYARGVKDARMSVVGPLATNLRRNIQRQPVSPSTTGAQTLTMAGPPPILGLARSASAHTSVLPQARVQRDENSQNPTQNQLVPVPQTTGTLPLAPPGPAPENPNRNAPAPSPAPPASRPAPSLPLAPVIAREGGEASPKTPSGGNTDSELNDLLAGLEGDANSTATDSGDPMNDINLDELADQLLPYIKRLMGVERERHEPI